METIQLSDDAVLELMGEKPVQQQQNNAANTNDAPTTQTQNTNTQQTSQQENAIDETEFLKSNFGWDSAEVGKQELEALRKLKDNPVSFADDNSRKIFDYIRENKTDDLYNFLDQQRKLSSIDTLSALEAIKLDLQQKNPHYKAADIQDIIEERYIYPEKPIKAEDEDQGVYDAKVAKWQEAYDKVTRRMERDSFTSKADLQKLKTDLVLPDIPRVDLQAQEAALKEQQAIAEARKTYLAALDSDSSKFTGFNTEYKDKEVTLPISFLVDEKEQKALKDSANSFDINEFWASRWFPKEGPNIQQLQADRYLLENRDKILQKVATEAVNQYRDHLLKVNSNTKLNTGNNQTNVVLDEQKANKEKAVDDLVNQL